MENSKLKPCPFCGSSDVGFHYTSGRGRGNHTGFMIKCKKCGGAGELVYSRAGNPVSEAEEQAVKAWNTRAERTCRPNPIYNRIFECDVCGEMDTDGVPNYCPGCGARVIHE